MLEMLEASLSGNLPDCEFAFYWGDDHESITGLQNLRQVVIQRSRKVAHHVAMHHGNGMSNVRSMARDAASL